VLDPFFPPASADLFLDVLHRRAGVSFCMPSSGQPFPPLRLFPLLAGLYWLSIDLDSGVLRLPRFPSMRALSPSLLACFLPARIFCLPPTPPFLPLSPLGRIFRPTNQKPHKNHKTTQTTKTNPMFPFLALFFPPFPKSPLFSASFGLLLTGVFGLGFNCFPCWPCLSDIEVGMKSSTVRWALAHHSFISSPGGHSSSVQGWSGLSSATSLSQVGSRFYFGDKMFVAAVPSILWCASCSWGFFF